MRVVIAEDEALLRGGHRAAPDRCRDRRRWPQRAPDALLAQVASLHPDVAIVDIRMPPTHTDEGLVAAQAIRRTDPSVAVLVLSHFVESRYAMRLMEDHPASVGYLLKDRVSDVAVLVDALTASAEGESVLDPTIVRRLMTRPREPGPMGELTEREREVLSLIAEGHSNRAISDRLFLSLKTVETHIRQIFMKLGLDESPDQHRRVLAVLAFLRG